MPTVRPTPVTRTTGGCCGVSLMAASSPDRVVSSRLTGCALSVAVVGSLACPRHPTTRPTASDPPSDGDHDRRGRRRMIRARGLRKSYGDFEAVRGIDLDVRAGRGVRVPGAQRRRQVLDDADDRRGLPAHRRRAGDPRPGPGHPRPGDPGPAGRLPAGGHPRPRAQRPREPLVYGRYFGIRAGRGRRPRRRAARVRAARPRRRRRRSTTSPAA